jgi:N-dimethylarginine dimethylaminohydrolase
VGRMLCSPPAYLDLTHLLNDWMRWDEEVDRARAVRQWDRLVAALTDAGTDVVVLPPDPRTPALTFTRDLGVAVDGELVTLTNLGPRGRREPRRAGRWLGRAGVPTRAWDAGDLLEGGNVVRTGWGWLVGVRATVQADPTRRFARHLRDTTGERVAVVPLTDPRFGHLDMVLADLGPLWLAHPPALTGARWGDPRWDAITGGRPVVEVTDDEADRLAANVVRVGDVVVGDLTPRLARRIEAAGLSAAPVPLDEMRKAGGGAHCLTLELPEPAVVPVGAGVGGATTGGDRRPSGARPLVAPGGRITHGTT